MSFQNCKIRGVKVNPSLYHGHETKRGDTKFPVSPSMLKAFDFCASRWFNGYEPPSSESTEFGNLLDTLVLTPELFTSRYAIEPDEYVNEDGKKKPWHNGAKVCKEWNKTQTDNGLTITNQKGLKEAMIASARIFGDSALSSYLSESEKQVLVEGEWLDDATGLILPVRCLIDLVPHADSEWCETLGDLKSTRSASIMAFQRDVFKFGYNVQAAFDLDLFNAATGQKRMTWCFVVQENFPPFEIGRRMMRDVELGEQPESKNMINLGRVQYRRALANYAWCLKNGKWPSYDDSDESVSGWTPIEAEPFMEQQVMFAPRFGATEMPEFYESDPESHEMPIP